MSQQKYKFEQIEDKKWGIYLQDRLLATVSSYEACQSIRQLSTDNLSYVELKRAMMTYKKAINKSLIIG